MTITSLAASKSLLADFFEAKATSMVNKQVAIKSERIFQFIFKSRKNRGKEIFLQSVYTQFTLILQLQFFKTVDLAINKTRKNMIASTKTTNPIWLVPNLYFCQRKETCITKANGKGPHSVRKECKYFQLCSLILLLIGSTLCNGQTKKYKTKITANKQKIIPVGQPRIVKPKGTDPYTNIRCSLQDKSGNIWFGTTGAGVYRYDGKSFTNFTTKDGLNSDIVYSILEDKAGNIWFGTYNGVCRYDGKIVTRLPIPGVDDVNYYLFNSLHPFNYARNQFSFEKKAIFSMIQDKAGTIWIGTSEMGLYRYDGKSFTNFKYINKAWKRMPGSGVSYNDGLQKNAIQCILEDNKGNIWFSAVSHGGVYRYDGNSFTHFAETNVFGKSHVVSMLEDKNGNLWFATRDDGVVRYDGTSFVNFTEKDGLCDNFTSSMMEDSKGNIWFSSSRREEAGRTEGCVTRYDGKTFTRFPLEGLKNTSIWSMVEDKAGNLWFGSRNVGLYRYDGKSFTNFSEKETKK